MTPDELTHHGIPGMKWGVRRARANTPGKSSGGKPIGKGAVSTKVEVKPRKLTSKEAEAEHARILARRELGRNIAISVVATAGGIAAASIGGPLVGAAANAAIREASKMVNIPGIPPQHK